MLLLVRVQAYWGEGPNGFRREKGFETAGHMPTAKGLEAPERNEITAHVPVIFGAFSPNGLALFRRISPKLNGGETEKHSSLLQYRFQQKYSNCS
jgi:hypothetical protein